MNIFLINCLLYIYEVLYFYIIYIKSIFIKTNDSIRDDFIYVKKNFLSKQLCKEIIIMFENSNNKIPGMIASGINFKIRNTIGLQITGLDDWKDIYTDLYIKIRSSLDEYLKNIIDKTNNQELFADNFIHEYCDILTIQIHRYRKKEGLYVWHNDFIYTEGIRYISFIVYLNDVSVGGETEFVYEKVKPETGKILFFPSTWTYLHRGVMPISNDKYIIVGWIGIK
jgi:hypothetical protein